MLVLSRKPHQTITMTTASGEIVIVTLVDIRGDKAWIGFEAPPTVRIVRDDAKETERNGTE